MVPDRKKAKGAVSLTFLLLLTVGTGLMTVLGSVLWQQLASQKRQLQARQWAHLFISFCRIRETQPVEMDTGRKDLVTVKLTPEAEPLTIQRELLSYGNGLIRQETLFLVAAGGYRPMKVTRYSLMMPKMAAGSYPEGSVWDNRKGPEAVDVPWEAYSSLPVRGVMPDVARMAKPVSGYLFVKEKKEDKESETNPDLVLPGTVKLQGSGVFVCEHGIVFNRNFRLNGDFRLLAKKDVVIGPNVVLDKVFLYSGGSIKIGKNSQVKGILVAKESVELEQGASIIEDQIGRAHV